MAMRVELCAAVLGAKGATKGRAGLAKVLWTGATLAAFALGASTAKAQCTDNFGLVPAAGNLVNQTFYPLGVGTALSSIVSTMNTVNTAFLTNSASFASARDGAEADRAGAGVWGRTVAGIADTKFFSLSSIDVSKSIVPIPITGNGTCQGSIHERYAGVQFGYDLYAANIGNARANFHVGVTGGYFDAGTRDTTPAGNDPILVSPAGTMSSTSQVPFVGAYAVFTQGNFFADTQVRFDFYLNNLTDSPNRLNGAGLDAKGVSFTGNVGYKIALGSNWFLEPSAGGVWSHVSVDPFTAPGRLVIGCPFPFNPATCTTSLVGKGSVVFDDIESILGRASVRIGTTFTTGFLSWQPYTTASVFREFAGPVSTRSEITEDAYIGNIGRVMTTTVSRIGTYAQYSVGTVLVLGNSGWLGYGKVDYKTGENVEGVGGNVGLRYQW
jgi:autotransporter-like protein